MKIVTTHRQREREHRGKITNYISIIIDIIIKKIEQQH